MFFLKLVKSNHNAESVARVTHTHTHTHTINLLNGIKNNILL